MANVRGQVQQTGEIVELTQEETIQAVIQAIPTVLANWLVLHAPGDDKYVDAPDGTPQVLVTPDALMDLVGAAMMVAPDILEAAFIRKLKAADAAAKEKSCK